VTAKDFCSATIRSTSDDTEEPLSKQQEVIEFLEEARLSTSNDAYQTYQNSNLEGEHEMR
jgi:hypothetical protein